MTEVSVAFFISVFLLVIMALFVPFVESLVKVLRRNATLADPMAKNDKAAKPYSREVA
jgi:hypothetical protein